MANPPTSDDTLETAPPAPDAARRIGATDGLVFLDDASRLRLIGGVGRGAGWADIVEVELEDEPVVDRAWRGGTLVRSASPEPRRIVGPYWARHAAVVPMGNEFVVVFGGPAPLNSSDAEIVGAAAQLVAETRRVTAEKLLSDELEVVQAVRALTSYRPTSVRDTARHVATIAARALSCDVAAVQVRAGDRASLEILRIPPEGDSDPDPVHAGPDMASFLEAAGARSGPTVEQAVAPDPRVWADDVVSRLTLPIGADERLGAITLGHASTRPRGFTMLCQRIGRALADSAELLLVQAISTERLARERDRLRQASETDDLTGVGNRTAWTEALARAVDRTVAGGVSFAVLSADLDGLKTINDRDGHVAGDAVIRAAADALRTCVRADDVIARVGGDEFLVMLVGADEAVAKRLVRRITRTLASWRVTEHGLTPTASIGWATFDGDADRTVAAADARMYRAKRRRASAEARADQAATTRSRPRRLAR